MGFSTSGATAIVFIGMLVAVGIAYPVLQSAHDERLSAIDDRDDRTLEMRNTAISVEEASYNGSELTVNVTNTGSTTLSVPATDLLIDGIYWTESADDDVLVEGQSDRERWQPGERLTIIVSTSEQPNRVKVVTEYGIAETAEVTNG